MRSWTFACLWTASILYWALWPIVSYDVPSWVLSWYAHILDVGQVEAFAQPFSNYTPPYLYVLAAFSLLDPWLSPLAVLKSIAAIQSVVLALSVAHLLRVLGAPNSYAGAATVLVLPPVVLNGPFLAQSDPLWVAPCVMAVAEALKRRTGRMLIWCGVAGAVKLQAAFLAPFALGMMLRLKAPASWITVPLIVAGALMLPAALAGWPLSDLATIYIRQVEWGAHFISNAASPWTVGNFAPEVAMLLFPLGYAAAIGAAAGIVIFGMRSDLDKLAILRLALLSAIAVPYFLPRMHERYFLLADILAFSLAWVDRRHVPTACYVIASSTLALTGYLLDLRLITLASAVLMSVALFKILRSFWCEAGERPSVAAAG